MPIFEPPLSTYTYLPSIRQLRMPSKNLIEWYALKKTHRDMSAHGDGTCLNSVTERRTDGATFKYISTKCSPTGTQVSHHPFRTLGQIAIAPRRREAISSTVYDVEKHLPSSISCDSIKKKDVMLYCGAPVEHLTLEGAPCNTPERKHKEMSQKLAQKEERRVKRVPSVEAKHPAILCKGAKRSLRQVFRLDRELEKEAAKEEGALNKVMRRVKMSSLKRKGTGAATKDNLKLRRPTQIQE